MQAFIRHEPPESALARELYPEHAEWATRVKTNAILADIYDVLTSINANLIAIGSGRAAKKPKPYPRPVKNDDERHIGRGALPRDELRAWFDMKRKQHA